MPIMLSDALCEIPFPLQILSKKKLEMSANNYYRQQDIGFSIKVEDPNNQDILSVGANPNIYRTGPDSIRTIYVCCHQEFDDKFEHFDHMLGHMKVVKCYICDCWYSTDDEMINHCLAQHTCQWCRFCSQTFNGKADLFNHLRLVHNYPPQKAPAWKRKRPRQWHNKPSDYVSKKKRKRTKVKPTFIKTEPTGPYPKVEPNVMNVKMQPTYTNVANIKVEPTNVSIKVEPT